MDTQLLCTYIINGNYHTYHQLGVLSYTIYTACTEESAIAHFKKSVVTHFARNFSREEEKTCPTFEPGDICVKFMDIKGAICRKRGLPDIITLNASQNQIKVLMGYHKALYRVANLNQYYDHPSQIQSTSELLDKRTNHWEQNVAVIWLRKEGDRKYKPNRSSPGLPCMIVVTFSSLILDQAIVTTKMTWDDTLCDGDGCYKFTSDDKTTNVFNAGLLALLGVFRDLHVHVPKVYDQLFRIASISNQ
jgi:hypothetical protein